MNLHETAAAVLSYALQSGLLLVVGLVLPKILKLRQPEVLLAYWRTLLGIVLLLPIVFAAWAPQQTLEVLRFEAGAVETVVASTLPTEEVGVTGTDLVFLAGFVALLGLIRLVGGFVYLQRCRRTAVPLAPVPSAVGSLQRRFMQKVPFLISDRLSTPLTFGWLRPAVLVPNSFQTLSEDEQEAIACHELLHIQRRDWAMTVFEEVVRALLWFHPAVWVLLSKIALSREKVVDAGTVRLTGKRKQYLEALWRTVCADRRTAVALAIPLLGKSNLFERVEWLRKERTMDKKMLLASAAVAALALAGAGLLGAAVFPATSLDAIESGPNEVPAVPERNSSEATDQERKKSGEKQLKRADGGEMCNEISHPVAHEKVPPAYPESARKEKVMGMVILETVITEQGEVSEARVLESPDERLSQAAMDSVLKWTFDPALCDGRPVAVYFNLTVNFRLE